MGDAEGVIEDVQRVVEVVGDVERRDQCRR